MDWNGLLQLFIQKLPEILGVMAGLYGAYRLPSPDQQKKQ